MGSPNVVRCKKCNKEIGEEEASFKPTKELAVFKIKCGLCKKSFKAHHREFYKRGTEPRMGNPFVPLYILPRGD
jgi:hypothetical protein